MSVVPAQPVSVTGLSRAGKDAARGLGPLQAATVSGLLEEVLPELTPSKNQEIRSELSRNSPFALSMQRALLSLDLVAILACSAGSEEDFDDSVGLLRDVDFAARHELLAVVALAFLRRELAKVREQHDGDLQLEVVEARFDQLRQFIQHSVAHPRTRR